MAGPWISRNPLTKRDEYLYLKRCFSEEFSECWRQYESRSSTEELATEDGMVGAQDPSARKKVTAEATSSGKSRAKGKAEKSALTDATPPEKRALENALTAAIVGKESTQCMDSEGAGHPRQHHQRRRVGLATRRQPRTRAARHDGGDPRGL